MRTLRRLAAVTLAAAAGLTCTDGTGPGNRGVAYLALQPQLAPAAAAAYSALGQIGLTVNNVRIELKRADGRKALDTTIVIPSGAEELTLSLPVVTEVAEEEFTALLQLRNDANVLFAGVQKVRSGQGQSPVPVPTEYQGPGKNATRLEVTPDTSISASSTLQLRVKGFDAQNAQVTDLLLAWSVDDATLGSVSATGVLTPTGKRGRVRVTARMLNGIAADADIDIVPTAARVVVIAGGEQTARAGDALPQPVKLQVLATDGQPSTGVQVALRAISGGGSISPALATADGSGHMEASIVLGRAVGSQSFGARIVGTEIEAIFDIVAQPAPAASLAIALGDGQAGVVGTAAALQLVVRVSNTFGELAPGAVVKWEIESGGGSLAAGESVAGDDGTARMSYTFGHAAGNVVVVASLPNTDALVRFGLQAKPGAPASMDTVRGTVFRGIAGDTLRAPLPAVIVRDAFGNGVPLVPVSLSLLTATGEVPQGAVPTNADGYAEVPAMTLPTVATTLRVKASVDGVTPVTFTILVEPATPSRYAVTASDGAPLPGASVTLTARLQDANGNAVREAGRTVSWSSTNGGSFSSASSVTDAEGMATVSFTAAASSGVTHEVRATDGTNASITGATIVTTQSPGSTYKVTASVMDPIQGTSITVWAQLVDGSNAPVAEAGRTVDWTASNGAVLSATQSVTNASGIASVTVTTANVAGTMHEVQARDAVNTAMSGAVVVTTRAPSAATSLTIVSGNGQAGTVNTALAQPLLVEVRDAQGQPLAGASVAWSSSGGVLGTSGSSAAQSITDAVGRATMTYRLPTISGTATITAQVSGLPPVQFTASAAAGPSAMLVLARSPSASVTSGQPFATQPVVWVADQYGNATPDGAGRIVIADVENTSYTLAGDTVVADANGHATFTALAPAGPAGSVTIFFGANPSLPVISAAVEVVAAANTLAARDSTAFTALAGGYFGTSRPAVRVTSPSGAPVSGATVTFTQTVDGAPYDYWTVTTDSLGVGAFPDVPLPTQAGVATFLATASSTTGSVQFDVNVVANVVGLVEILAGDMQAVPQGSTLPQAIVVRATDYYGNPVAGAPVRWSLWYGAGTFSGADTITGSDGRATAMLTVTNAGAATVAVEVGETGARVAPRLAVRAPVAPPYTTVRRNGREIRIYSRTSRRLQRTSVRTAARQVAAYEGGYGMGLVRALGIPSGVDFAWMSDADSVAGSDEWSRAANWRTPTGAVASTAPGSASTVYIPITYYTQMPRLTADAAVGTVLTENGADVELQDFRLEVTTGGVRTLLGDGLAWFTSSTASHAGVVTINGTPGQTLHGNFPSLVVNTAVKLTQSLQTDYHLTVNGEMDLGGRPVYVGGDFRLDGPAAGLVLADAAWAQLYVEGNATFEGRDAATDWVRGYLVFNGDLTVNGTYSPRTYRGTGEELYTEFTGVVAQAVNGTAPWGTTMDAPVSAFSTLLVSQVDTMRLTFSAAPAITGHLWVYSASDLVFPAGTPSLALGADFYQEPGATFTNLQTLELNGDSRYADAYGALPPDVVVNGSYTTSGLAVPANLTVAGTLAQYAPVTVGGSLVASGTVNLNGNALEVGGALSLAQGTGRLVMKYAGSALTVRGPADFSGADAAAQSDFTAGTMTFLGDVTAEGARSLYAADTAAKVRFAGSAEQKLVMNSNDAQPYLNQLGTVKVEAGSSVRITGNAYTPFNFDQYGKLFVDQASALVVGAPQTTTAAFHMYDNSVTDVSTATTAPGVITVNGTCTRDPAATGNYQCPPVGYIAGTPSAGTTPVRVREQQQR